MTDVTHILARIEQGDPHAAEQLLPLVYEELRKLAAQKLAHEKPGQTLQATALVHEAYLRLVASGARDAPSDSDDALPPSAQQLAGDPAQWNSRGHFFAAAAEAMRRILVENARRKARIRHDGEVKRIALSNLDVADPRTAADPDEELLALDEALSRFAQEEPAAAEVVKLRYFTGLTIEQAAAALKISVRTANRHFVYAKAWLARELRAAGQDVH
ncbi:MAG: sigma-70 family RNA polymerase sigma factor [Planctomycetia bacterium]|nr:sigma-70 family RNA polymerase sigma factor [Planctomycetia bacterium]